LEDIASNLINQKNIFAVVHFKEYSTTFAFLKKSKDAQVAKLVDALCSGRSVRKDVLVRIQSWALK
jgi:hypothetical protein